MLDKVIIYVSQQAQEATPVHRPKTRQHIHQHDPYLS